MKIAYRLLHEAGDLRRSGSAALDLAYVDFDLSTAVVASNAECLEGLCRIVLEEAAGESA